MVRFVHSTVNVYNNSFTAFGEPGEFYWNVYAKRLSIEVEPSKDESKLMEMDQYSWLTSK